MNLFDLVNLGTIGTTCWCAAFAATNFGNKFGRLWGFQNTTGYKYISDADSEKIDKHYEQIVKVAEKDKGAPPWAKNKEQLKAWCNKYEKSLRYWGQTVKYCVIQKNIRHRIVDSDLDFKAGLPNDKCTDDLLNSFSDSNNDLAFIIARKDCTDPKKTK